MDTKKGLLPVKAKGARTFLLSTLQETGSCMAQSTQDWTAQCATGCPSELGFTSQRQTLVSRSCGAGGLKTWLGVMPCLAAVWQESSFL